jgi:hypothetical protein
MVAFKGKNKRKKIINHRKERLIEYPKVLRQPIMLEKPIWLFTQ